MKKVLILKLISLFILINGCKSDTINNQNYKTQIANECFAGVDTMKTAKTDGCSGSIYKIIDSNLVIRINPFLKFKQYDTCFTINVDTAYGKIFTELFVYKKGEVNLDNICTDLMVKSKEPLRSFPATKGQILVLFSDPTNYFGNVRPHVSILIKELIFIDPKTNKQIVIENELIWKVFDINSAG